MGMPLKCPLMVIGTVKGTIPVLMIFGVVGIHVA